MPGLKQQCCKACCSSQSHQCCKACCFPYYCGFKKFQEQLQLKKLAKQCVAILPYRIGKMLSTCFFLVRQCCKT